MAFFKALEKAAEEWEIEAMLTTPMEDRDSAGRSLSPTAPTTSAAAPAAQCKSSKAPKWTPADDQLLKTLVPKLKPDWKAIADHFPGRPKSMVRRRWENRFDPDIKRTPWSEEEDLTIVTLLEKIGPVWKEIAARMDGRPPDVIKNRYYGHIKRQKAPAKPSTSPSEPPQSESEEDWEKLINLPEDANDQVVSPTAKQATIEELQREIERLETQWKMTKDKLKEMEERQGEEEE